MKQPIHASRSPAPSPQADDDSPGPAIQLVPCSKQGAAPFAGPSGDATKHSLRAQGRLARWPAGSNSMKPQPHFLTIRWEATAEDGTPVTLQATLCKAHRQVIALKSTSARGVRRQLGESCDLCSGREPKALGGEPRDGQ